MISNKTLKTDQLQINFYFEDIITCIKNHNPMLNIQRNSKTIYHEIIKNKYENYNIIGQSIWDQYIPQNPWNTICKNTFCLYTWLENNNILYMLLHYATRNNDHICRWTNQKHLKTPKYNSMKKLKT